MVVVMVLVVVTVVRSSFRKINWRTTNEKVLGSELWSPNRGVGLEGQRKFAEESH
jgi:hypothetical protein